MTRERNEESSEAVAARGNERRVGFDVVVAGAADDSDALVAWDSGDGVGDRVAIWSGRSAIL